MATTFEPSPDLDESVVTHECSFNTLSYLYIMNVVDARPIQILDDGSESYTDLTATHRRKALSSSGIASSPKIVFLPDSEKIQVMVGKEPTDLLNGKIQSVFWHAK